jgi:hypothetical protein
LQKTERVSAAHAAAWSCARAPSHTWPHAGQAACLHTVRKNTGTVRFWTWSYNEHRAWLSAAYGGHNPAITRPSIELCSAPCNASALRADRYAASGIDGASAQLTTWHLRDGRRGDCLVRPDG